MSSAAVVTGALRVKHLARAFILHVFDIRHSKHMKLNGRMDDVTLHPFQQYFSHIRMMSR